MGLSPEPSDIENNFVTQMYDQGLIKHKSFGFFIGDTSDQSYLELGVMEDKTQTNATVVWVPLISTNYWAVNLGYCSYANTLLDLSTKYAVLDTGTSLLGFP